MQAVFSTTSSSARWQFNWLAWEWIMVMCLLGFAIIFFPGGFCIGVMARGSGARHCFHLCPLAVLAACSARAPSGPKHRGRLELKLLLGISLHKHRFPSNIHYYFKHGKKVYSGFPENVGAEFGLAFPTGGGCRFLCETISLFSFFFLRVFLLLFPVFSLLIHMCCVPMHL